VAGTAVSVGSGGAVGTGVSVTTGVSVGVEVLVWVGTGVAVGGMGVVVKVGMGVRVGRGVEICATGVFVAQARPKAMTIQNANLQALGRGAASPRFGRDFIRVSGFLDGLNKGPTILRVFFTGCRTILLVRP
jgi:hypothetical protein